MEARESDVQPNSWLRPVLSQRDEASCNRLCQLRAAIADFELILAERSNRCASLWFCYILNGDPIDRQHMLSGFLTSLGLEQGRKPHRCRQSHHKMPCGIQMR